MQSCPCRLSGSRGVKPNGQDEAAIRATGVPSSRCRGPESPWRLRWPRWRSPVMQADCALTSLRSVSLLKTGPRGKGNPVMKVYALLPLPGLAGASLLFWVPAFWVPALVVLWVPVLTVPALVVPALVVLLPPLTVVALRGAASGLREACMRLPRCCISAQRPEVEAAILIAS